MNGPSLLTALPDAAAAVSGGKAAARLLAQVTGEVRALLQERQDRRKAELDAHRRDVRFALGDEVLLDTEHSRLPSRSLLSPRWMGPFTVLACPAPNTYRLDLPSSWWWFNEFNVDRLWPYVRRPAHLDGEPDLPAPVVCADGAPEHEVAELLKFKMRYGRPHVLPGWCGVPAATRRATRGSLWRT
jgi:hypothetical protein